MTSPHKTSLPKRLGAGLLALLIAAALWLPCLHFLFKPDPQSFRTQSGISPVARELAARHLHLWTDPLLRQQELDRMRGSNAEWDFMGRSFLVWSLVNMGLREPADRERYLPVIDQIIDETLRLEREQGMFFFLMLYARGAPFAVQPAQSLFLESDIALMMAARRELEEKAEYRALMTERINRIMERFQRGPLAIAESYPDECWMYDHAVAMAAIRLADHLDGTDHSQFLREWIALAKAKLLDAGSGLLISSFTTQGQPLDGPEGSTIWVVAHFLALIDPDFALDQYRRARRELGQIHFGFGYGREWPASWTGPTDIDSGPIVPVLQISAGSSGLAFVAAATFGDDEFLTSLATTLNFAAFPSRTAGRLRYCASNQVGDAALLYALVAGPLEEKVKGSPR